jgi:hypothetical protein
MKWIICVTLLASVVSAQGDKKVSKPFTPPEDQILIEQLLAKDEGCLKDLAKSRSMEGLELRKYLGELAAYRCVQLMPGVHFVKILNVKQWGQGKSAVQVRQVRLLSFEHGNISEGWVFADQLTTSSAVKKALDSAKEKDR